MRDFDENYDLLMTQIETKENEIVDTEGQLNQIMAAFREGQAVSYFTMRDLSQQMITQNEQLNLLQEELRSLNGVRPER